MSDLAGPGPLPERDLARDLRLNEYRPDWRGPVTERTGVHVERCESPGEVVQLLVDIAEHLLFTEGVSVGDAVRFTLRGAPPNVQITAIDKTRS